MVVPQLLLSLRPQHCRRRRASDDVHPRHAGVYDHAVPGRPGQDAVCSLARRLMPHFLPPHLVVLVGILLAMFVAVPVACWPQLSGLSRSDCLRWALRSERRHCGAFNSIASASCSFRWLLFYSLMTDWGMKFLDHRNAADHVELHADPGCRGTRGRRIGWLWRLCHMSEEMRRLSEHVPGASWLGGPARKPWSSGALLRPRLAAIGFSCAVGDWWHDRTGRLLRRQPGRAGAAAAVRTIALSRWNSGPVSWSPMPVCMGIFLDQARASCIHEVPARADLYLLRPVCASCARPNGGELLAQRRPRMAIRNVAAAFARTAHRRLVCRRGPNSAVFWLMMNVSLGIVLAMRRQFSLRPSRYLLLLVGRRPRLRSIGAKPADRRSGRRAKRMASC